MNEEMTDDLKFIIQKKKINTMAFFRILQFLLHIIFALCGTYLIYIGHIKCGIFLYIMIFFTTYDYKI